MTRAELREKACELLKDVYDDYNFICDDREVRAVEEFARDIRNKTLEEAAKELEQHIDGSDVRDEGLNETLATSTKLIRALKERS